MIAAISTVLALAQPAVPKTDDAAIVHVLNRIGFGPTPAAIERVRRVGIRAYVDEQLHPERIDDQGDGGAAGGLFDARQELA